MAALAFGFRSERNSHCSVDPRPSTHGRPKANRRSRSVGCGPGRKGQVGFGVLGDNLGLRTAYWTMVGLEGCLGWGGARRIWSFPSFRKGGGSPKVLSRDLTGWPELWRRPGKEGRGVSVHWVAAVAASLFPGGPRQSASMSAGTG